VRARRCVWRAASPHRELRRVREEPGLPIAVHAHSSWSPLGGSHGVSWTSVPRCHAPARRGRDGAPPCLQLRGKRVVQRVRGSAAAGHSSCPVPMTPAARGCRTPCTPPGSPDEPSSLTVAWPPCSYAPPARGMGAAMQIGRDLQAPGPCFARTRTVAGSTPQRRPGAVPDLGRWSWRTRIATVSRSTAGRSPRYATSSR